VQRLSKRTAVFGMREKFWLSTHTHMQMNPVLSEIMSKARPSVHNATHGYSTVSEWLPFLICTSEENDKIKSVLTSCLRRSLVTLHRIKK